MLDYLAVMMQTTRRNVMRESVGIISLFRERNDFFFKQKTTSTLDVNFTSSPVCRDDVCVCVLHIYN